MTSDDHSVDIELARPEDAKSIVRIQRQTWLDTYPNKQFGITREDIEAQFADLEQRIERWRQRITLPVPDLAVFIGRVDDEIVGYAASTIIEGQRRIGAIYVLPKAQGQGLGGQLLQKSIEWHRHQARNEPIFLHVVSYNEKAVRFYEKYGFKKTDTAVSDDIAKLPSGASMPEFEMILEG